MSTLEFISYVDSLERTDRGIRLRVRTDKGNTAIICIEYPFEDTIRVRLYKDRELDDVFSILSETEACQIQVSRSKEGILISTRILTCQIRLVPYFHMQILDRTGEILWAEQENDYNVRGLSRVPRLGFSLKKKQINKIVDTFTMKSGEQFLGYGEQFCCLNQRGREITNWNLDAYGVETGRTYKNTPFFLSSRGYGMFVNSTTKIRHFIGSPEVSCSSYVLEIEAPQLDYFIILGPSFKKIINRYTDLTGKPPLPPMWAFGLWMSRCYYHNRAIVESIAQQLRKLRIPCDVLVFDSYWMRDNHLCDLIWDEKRFHDPTTMLAQLKNQGYKVCSWEAPYVPVGSELFDEGKEHGYFLSNTQNEVYTIDAGLVRASHDRDGFEGQETVGTFGQLEPAPSVAIVDFTNPDATRWYQTQHEPLLRMGTDVFKTDFGEQVPEDAHSSYSGINGKQLHNLYPLLYNKAVFDITKVYKRQPIVWARSAWAGSQCYPVHWGGDPQTSFSSMAASLRGGLNLGLSGIPFWGHDIGGFYGKKPSPKLYIRWAQFGLLSSLARCHGTTPREPWEYGEDALRIFRQYAELRYRLIPYLYSYAYQATRKGLPIMRPLLLEFQDDPAARAIDSQYLLGQWILVAPLFNESDHRTIYLPKGSWYDYWTGATYTGPQYLEYTAPLEVLPLFIRGGAIIPQGPEMQFVGEKPFDPITLSIFPDEDTDFLLYLDDETVEIACSATPKQVVLSIGSSSKSYIAHILGIQCPMGVESNKGPIPPIDGAKDAQNGWVWSANSGLVVNCPPAPSQITIIRARNELSRTSGDGNA